MRKLVVITAGGGLALASTGCGLIPGIGEDPFDTLVNAVQDTRSVDSFRAEVSVDGAFGGAAPEGATEMEYVAEPEPTTRLQLDIPGQGQSQTLIRGSEMLMEGDPSLGQPEWLRMDLSEYGEQQPPDPVAQIEQLVASDGVEEVGPEEIEGTATTHYTGSYPITDGLDEIEDAQTRENLAETYDQMGVEEVQFDVWISDEGLPRRTVNELGDVSTTVDFLEFNSGVSIDYPSEDQIEDFGVGPDLDMDLDELPDAPGDVGDMPELPDAPDLEEMEDSLEELEESLQDT
ncbi:hypothetical protein RIF23_06625 [Lipingzhangella sp. LS1_29]|uniref:Outer membrane lipoprotein-sorting protein n=1 Tax=Lipingzhangella rawalii TaxID=2055835 RepID=A0ABU2H3U1_9ACTN|nr:hypothetical protein [Lipingzhangella rawalii]MDS1269968.1 hypothetical protein [Lipingzhangella rawalii]